ncbi:hypothetical protein Ahy_A03g010988 isoform A [Arachis hypogaea]|uniref:DYW domain-containing protein n=1 Tax=Arachis hypogaea TaxID=3818 RepID=A0A445DP75_ARAHY|nr:hypothetical protein Ahy_A03g010988 isoform A [Arachis hypogaea]
MATTQTPLLFSTNNNGQPFIHNSHTRLFHLLNHSIVDISHLKQIHAQLLRTIHTNHHPQSLLLHSRILHHSSLLDLGYATRIFHHFQNPNSFMWNTLIRAYARTADQKHKSMELYKAMLMMEREQQSAAVIPDNYTYPFVLKACAYLFSLSEGKQVHAHVLKLGLIHFYATCGFLDLAHKVFEKMSERSEVSWNIMIDSYASAGEYDTALRMFCEMQRIHDPDGYTMQSVISSCAGLGALSLVFESMPYRDVNSWNSMILGLAMHGMAEEALDYYARMVKVKGLMPNSITFVGVLSACNHRGMVNEGIMSFDIMTREYKIEPRLEHYGCLVDLFARAGRIEEAMNLVSEMPMKPDVVIWRSLLDACCKQHASLELSEELAKKVFESEGSTTYSSGAYVLLSRIYASASMWNDVGLLRKLMTDKGVNKEPGCSLVEIDGVTHEFFAGDTSHPQSEDIYKFMSEIEEKLEATGYVPDYSGAPLVDEVNEGKKNTMRLHSERLAIAFGLLSLRVCNDCHSVTKLLSRIYNVEIIVRDRARFHHFKEGNCSCKDYW